MLIENLGRFLGGTHQMLIMAMIEEGVQN